MDTEAELRRLRVGFVLISETARYHADLCGEPERKAGFLYLDEIAKLCLAPYVDAMRLKAGESDGSDTPRARVNSGSAGNCL